jgi:hypothetical protein
MGRTVVNMNSNSGTCTFTITAQSGWEITNPSNLYFVDKISTQETNASKISGEGVTIYTVKIPKNNSSQRQFNITVKLTSEWCEDVSVSTTIIQEGNN